VLSLLAVLLAVWTSIHGTAGDKTVDSDLAGLAQTMGTIHGLGIDSRIPIITGGAAGGVDFNTRARENRTKDIALWLADDDEAELSARHACECVLRWYRG
jgi:hypothetical protein